MEARIRARGPRVQAQRQRPLIAEHAIRDFVGCIPAGEANPCPDHLQIRRFPIQASRVRREGRAIWIVERSRPALSDILQLATDERGGLAVEVVFVAIDRSRVGRRVRTIDDAAVVQFVGQDLQNGSGH